MNRLFQGAATVDSVLRGDLIERAADAGLRSLFVGFESLDERNLRDSNKRQNLGKSYEAAIRRLDDLGVMVNGSFVFGLDGDEPDVFSRTVDWAVSRGITTATFHVATPYPGTGFFKRIEGEGRLLSRDWRRFDTRRAVFQPRHMTPAELEAGYRRAYRDFYSWRNIAAASMNHARVKHRAKHFFYAGGWKRFEPLWNLAIKARRLDLMRPALEAVLAQVAPGNKRPADFAQSAGVSLPVIDSPAASAGRLRNTSANGSEKPGSTSSPSRASASPSTRVGSPVL